MSTLGIGSRVWIGWCNSTGHPREATWARLHSGTVIDGPIHCTADHVGWRVVMFGRTFHLKRPTTYWSVAVDGGGKIAAEEWLLIPIDDGDAETDHARRNVAVET